MDTLVLLIPLLPLLGFVVLGLAGRRIGSEAILGAIGSGTVGISFVLSCIALGWLLQMPAELRVHEVVLYRWLFAGDFHVEVAFRLDPLSMVFALVVTGVGFLIHVYSIGYMHGDAGFWRFFAYLNLFIFMMLVLVLSNNLLLTFVGWEGVGLCSYLLIGFWYSRPVRGGRDCMDHRCRQESLSHEPGGRCRHVAGDVPAGTAVWHTALRDADGAGGDAPGGLGGAYGGNAACCFWRARGNRHRFRWQHGCPMQWRDQRRFRRSSMQRRWFTAGIFLVARLSALFALAPVTLAVITVVGAVTALWAATIGLVQTDIKKVLAYSTVSQLGFMFAALGVGAFSAAVFHVVTHAFFKALLFLGAGAVIHALHEQQNIHFMGGLRRYLPHTYRVFLVAGLAIAGIPPLSGFFSKDAILWNVFEHAGAGVWLVLLTAAFCTALYTFRLIGLVFHGEERFDRHHVHPHEAPPVMRIPLYVLAALSVVGGVLGIPYALLPIGTNPNLLETWLEPVFSTASGLLGRVPQAVVHWEEYALMLVATAVSVLAIALAWRWFAQEGMAGERRFTERLGALHRLLWHKYYVDEATEKLIVEPTVQSSERFLWRLLDVRLIDGAVNGVAAGVRWVAERLRRMQTGIAHRRTR
jgi:NADH-quinone oxidoreductase subunit L